MIHLKYLISLTILLTCKITSIAQTEFLTIPLDASLKEVSDIQQFSDEQGNILFCFRDKNHSQFSLIRHNAVETQTLPLRKKFDLLESLYDEDHFIVFYKNKETKALRVYQTDKQSLSDQFFEVNLPKNGKHLTEAFCQGDFLTFRFSNSPFTLHTYKYREDQYFEEVSQSFPAKKKEMILGQISTENEMIFVRFTLNPLTMHFYRYFNDSGFEKKSFEIRPLYQKAGINEKKVFLTEETLYDLNRDTPLAASIKGNDIYIDMEKLVEISVSGPSNKKPYPGVFRINWDNGNGEILSFDSKSNLNFTNRSVSLLDTLYFKLLVNKEEIEIAIFDIINLELLKKYAYNRNEKIEFIHGNAQLGKITTFSPSVSSTFYIPLSTKVGKGKEISNKKLLKYLAAGLLNFEVFSNDHFFELFVSGSVQREIVLIQTLIANFTSYLSKDKLEIIEDIRQFEYPQLAQIDDYLQQLSETNKNLGMVKVYPYQNQFHLAYIDNKKRQCTILAF